MSDPKTLVARLPLLLRNEAAAWTNLTPRQDKMLRDAAARIEALEKDNAELRHDIARHVAAVAAERNAALEEAAQIVDGRVHPDRKGSKIYAVCEAAAYRIRALKEPT